LRREIRARGFGADETVGSEEASGPAGAPAVSASTALLRREIRAGALGFAEAVRRERGDAAVSSPGDDFFDFIKRYSS
jgi:hypothetical protein